MKKAKKQQSLMQQLIVTCVILLILGVGQPFLWDYVFQSADALHMRRTEEQQLRELRARIDEIRSKYDEQQPLIDQLSVPFPKMNETSQVVDRLEQLADRVGVAMEIRNILTEPPVKKPGTNSTDQISSFVVTVKVDGTASALLQYIDAVEHIQEVVTIRQWNVTILPINLNQPVGAVLPPPFTMNMNVVFYLQK